MNLNSNSSISKSIANLFGRHSLISMTFFPYPFYIFLLSPSSLSLSLACRPLAWVSAETVAEDFHWYFIYSLINATILSSEREREWEQIYCVFLQFAPFLLPLTYSFYFSLLIAASLWGRHIKLWVKLPIRYSFALLCVWDLSRSLQVDTPRRLFRYCTIFYQHCNEFI